MKTVWVVSWVKNDADHIVVFGDEESARTYWREVMRLQKVRVSFRKAEFRP